MIMLDELWDQFNQPHVSRINVDVLPSYSAALRYFFKHDRVQVINLDAFAESDEHNLTAKGIFSRYLFDNLYKTLQRNLFDSRAFQLNAIRKKGIHAISPFSGKTLKTKCSLPANADTIFYRFQDTRIFYLVTSGIGSGFEKHGIYFPDCDLIVRVGEAWAFEKDDLVELKARVLSHFNLCCDYLSHWSVEGRQTAIFLGFYHFAHHLWNELTGLERLYCARLLKDIDKFLVLREPLGDLGLIFPEIPPTKIARIRTADELFREIVSKQYFAIKVGGTSIRRSLINRVNRVAFEKRSSATCEQIKEMKTSHWPLLWVGIRVGTRAWHDQVEALTNFLLSVSRSIPKVGVVFDGFSLPADRQDEQEYSDIIAKERGVVNEVIANLAKNSASIGIVDIIGSSIYDAIAWAHAVDCYLAPFGTLQHKVGWFARKPGIIHTNETLLNNPPHCAWTAVEGNLPPKYVRAGTVSDVHLDVVAPVLYKQSKDYAEVGAGIKAADRKIEADKEFNSYTVDWEPLADDIIALLERRSSAFAGHFEKAVLIHRTKSVVKAALRRSNTWVRGSEI